MGPSWAVPAIRAGGAVLEPLPSIWMLTLGYFFLNPSARGGVFLDLGVYGHFFGVSRHSGNHYEQGGQNRLFVHWIFLLVGLLQYVCIIADYCYNHVTGRKKVG
jgi:hypothetical protein